MEPGVIVVDRPTALIVAMSVWEELQDGKERVCVLPSAKVPVAVNCMVAATPIEGAAGVTAMDVNLFAEEPDMPEHVDMEMAAAVMRKSQNTRIAQARDFPDTTLLCAGIEKVHFCARAFVPPLIDC